MVENQSTDIVAYQNQERRKICDQVGTKKYVELDRHVNRSIEELREVSQTQEGKSRSIEPLAVRYVDVSNGQAVFVMRSFRRNIAEPLKYELLARQQELWQEETAAMSMGVRFPFNRDTENQGGQENYSTSDKKRDRLN